MEEHTYQIEILIRDCNTIIRKIEEKQLKYHNNTI